MYHRYKKVPGPGKGKRHSVAYRMRIAGYPLVGQLETVDVVSTPWRPGWDEQHHGTLDRLVDQGTLSHDARVPKGDVDQERRLPDRSDGRQVRALRYGGVICLKERLG